MRRIRLGFDRVSSVGGQRVGFKRANGQNYIEQNKRRGPVPCAPLPPLAPSTLDENPLFYNNNDDNNKKKKILTKRDNNKKKQQQQQNPTGDWIPLYYFALCHISSPHSFSSSPFSSLQIFGRIFMRFYTDFSSFL